MKNHLSGDPESQTETTLADSYMEWEREAKFVSALR
jgi:hypothetical protein